LFYHSKEIERKKEERKNLNSQGDKGTREEGFYNLFPIFEEGRKRKVSFSFSLIREKKEGTIHRKKALSSTLR